MKNLFRKMLRGLARIMRGTFSFRDPLPGVHGIVEVLVRDADGKVIYSEKQKNIVLDVGKTEIMDLIRNNVARETGGTVRSFCRFAVGDGGADAASLLTPKALDKTRTGLYREVWRQAVTSDTKPSGNAIEFTIDINSNSLLASYFNPANGGEYINEATIIASIPGTYPDGNGTATPGAIGPDDVSITHKTFKSFPFTPGLGIQATFKWTIYVIL